jgi:hypothetical protein
MAQYGELRADFVTYTTGVGSGEANHTVTVSSLVNNPSYSGSVTISGDLGVSGVSIFNDITVTGNAFFQQGLSATGNVNVTGIVIASGLDADNYVIASSGYFDTIVVSGNATVTGNANVSGEISGATDGGVNGSGYWRVAAGSTAERPTVATTGMIRFNTTLAQYEGFDGNWSLLGGGATGSGGDRVFVLNETGVTSNYTLTGFNASSAGPITIEDGIEVIVADPFNWSIV